MDYYINIASAQLSQTAGFIVACNATLPSLSFVIEGKTVTVPGSKLMGESVKISGFEGMCYARVSWILNVKEKISVLGAPFLEAYYTVFDSNGPRIGFAPQPDADVTPGGSVKASTDCTLGAFNMFVDVSAGKGEDI